MKYLTSLAALLLALPVLADSPTGDPLTFLSGPGEGVGKIDFTLSDFSCNPGSTKVWKTEVYLLNAGPDPLVTVAEGGTVDSDYVNLQKWITTQPTGLVWGGCVGGARAGENCDTNADCTGGEATVAPVLADGVDVCENVTVQEKQKTCEVVIAAGANRALVVFVFAEGTNNDSCQNTDMTVEYEGVPLSTAVFAETDGGTNATCMGIYYFTEAQIAAAGGSTLDVVYNAVGGSSHIAVYTAEFTGVDQTDIVDEAGTVAEEGLDGGGGTTEDPLTWAIVNNPATYQLAGAAFNDAPNDLVGFTTSAPWTVDVSVPNDSATALSFNLAILRGSASGAQTVSINQTTAATSRIAGASISLNGL